MTFNTPRLGRQPRWQEPDIAYLESLLKNDPRTYSSQQLADKLLQERQVQLSRYQVQRILKKKLSLETNQGKPPATARPSLARA